MADRRQRKPVKGLTKIIDESAFIRCALGTGEVREEVWADTSGEIVRYNLAFIYHRLFSADNGRVLGYDTAHGGLHRHFAGKKKMLDDASYGEIFDRF